MAYPLTSARIFNTPLIVHPAKAVAALHGLGPRFAEGGVNVNRAFAMEDDIDDIDADKPRAAASLIGGERAREVLESGYGYAIVSGVAIIPVAGVLVHRGSWIGNNSGVTSYEGLTAQLDAASMDDRVHGIALEIDCFGGEVAGCFDLADRIRAIGKGKPVRAFVTDYAFSAAYALASACDRIVVSRTSGVGSIGVICMHTDYSALMSKEGIGVTIVQAGARKSDGNPYEPLPEAVRDEWAAEMETLRQLFAQTVAAGRGDRLDAAAALASEARCFTGKVAVTEGLADEVSEPTAAFAAFAASLSDPKTPAAPAASPSARARTSGGRKMSQKSRRTRGMVDDEEQAIEEEDLDLEGEDDNPEIEGDEDEIAAEEEEDEKPAAQGRGRSARQAERDRVSKILNCAASAGQQALARHFAFDTGMSAASAIAALKAASADKGSATTGSLSSRMEGRGPRNALRPGGAGGGAQPTMAERLEKRLARK